MAQNNNELEYGEDPKKAEQYRAARNNANNIKNAADVAMASKNPYAMAAGGAVKAADKLTGGKSTEMLGKGMAAANKINPLGKKIQNASNRFSESGASDKIGKAASMKNGMPGRNQGGGPNSSLPSSNSNKNSDKGNSDNKDKQNNNSDKNNTDENSLSNSSNPLNNKKNNGDFFGSFIKKAAIKYALMVAPFVLGIFFIIIVVVVVGSNISDIGEALLFGSGDNGSFDGFEVDAESQDQLDFYERVNEVELSYQENGIDINGMQIVAVVHVLNSYSANIEYKDMTTSKIEQIADAMLLDDVYDQDTFFNNLVNKIIPKYIHGKTKDKREVIAEAVIDYVERYQSMVGDEGESYSSCSSSGTCTYSIKGFYIKGKGNVSAKMNIDNLYVRLMQCGTGNGHDYGGTFGKPLSGEELVPFEKYILGVALAEIGDGAPEHAFKAQLIAARSYILARHKDMGGWRTLKKENGKWVLQAAACTQDQVFCNPDKGCSTDKDGQWGMVYSGTSHGKTLKNALPKNSKYRTYASQTDGEVLVNKNGYIIYTGYLSDEQNLFTSLANSGKTYKQILLQVYNQGSRKYGAHDIKKASCGAGSTSGCSSTGDFASWKQCGAPWSNIKIGTGNSTICDIGCLATSVAILMAKSGVPTNVQGEFNPGSFVKFLNTHGGFDGVLFVWGSVSKVSSKFKHGGSVSLSGLSKSEKLKKINEYVSKANTYVVCEVKGGVVGEHWVAIDTVTNNIIKMMDPGSKSTNMWNQYNWENTSELHYFTASK